MLSSTPVSSINRICRLRSHFAWSAPWAHLGGLTGEAGSLPVPPVKWCHSVAVIGGGAVNHCQWSPLAVRSAPTLPFIGAISLRRIFSGFCPVAVCCWRLEGTCSFRKILRFMSSQACSMGFMTGDFAGHLSVQMSFPSLQFCTSMARWVRALFSWKSHWFLGSSK